MKGRYYFLDSERAFTARENEALGAIRERKQSHYFLEELNVEKNKEGVACSPSFYLPFSWVCNANYTPTGLIAQPLTISQFKTLSLDIHGFVLPIETTVKRAYRQFSAC